MGYYLDKADDNKRSFESLKFDAAQLNFVLKMMRQCSKLRQGKVVVNLLDSSLPDKFEIKSEQVKGDDDREYTNYTVVQKT